MKNRKVKRPVTISEQTLTRRSLLEWMGKATVLALGGDLVAACSPVKGPPIDIGGHLQGTPDAGSIRDQGSSDFPFSPGKAMHEVFEDWKENTVDPQNLVEVLEQWQLIVDGLVEEPMVLGFSDLLALERQDQIADFHCVEGWSVYDVPYNGFHLSKLFERVKPHENASHLTFTSIGDVYTESIPMDVALEPKTMLAYGIDESTIPLAHGFPLRLVVPRMLGYKQAKYLYRIEFTDQAESGYWVRLGYPYDAVVPQGRLREGRY